MKRYKVEMTLTDEQGQRIELSIPCANFSSEVGEVVEGKVYGDDVFWWRENDIILSYIFTIEAVSHSGELYQIRLLD